MVKLKLLTGPEQTGEEITQTGEDPSSLLIQMGRQNLQWEIDLSHASEEEMLEWGRADLTGRIVRALSHGRAVWFLGHEFRGFNEETLTVLEETISSSGLHVAVENDDEQGLVIGTLDTRRSKPLPS